MRALRERVERLKKKEAVKEIEARVIVVKETEMTKNVDSHYS